MEQGLRSVFISYSRLSEGFVQQIVDDLRRCGVEDVWWDNHLTGGQDWWPRILQQIRQADVLVCLVDVGASESLAVRREYKYANDLGKAVLPVLLTSDVNVSQLPVELAGKQYVDYRPQNHHPYDDLCKALRELPPTPSLPNPLPPEPEMPRSPTDYLVGRISSPERLSEEAQNSVLNQLRRLAGSEDAQDREFAQGWLRKLRKRPELNAQVADDIDAICVDKGQNKTQAEKPNGTLGKIAALVAIAIVAVVGYQQFTGFNAEKDPETQDPPGSTIVSPVVSTSNPITNTTTEPNIIAEEQLIDSGDQNDQPAAVSSVTENPTVKPVLDDAGAGQTADTRPEPLPVAVAEPEPEPEPEPVTNPESINEPIQEQVATKQPEPYWQQDFNEFLDTPFDLCGFKKFTVSVSSTGGGASSLIVRSTDRSIPDQPFRGLEKQVSNNQLTELFPGCRVQISYNKTSRIRLQVQGEK